MGWVVADTHAALWLMENDERLSPTATAALESAERILIPSISLVEITYLIEKQRLSPAVLPRIFAELENPATTLVIAPLDLGVVLAVEQIPRHAVPDMPDRIVAATAGHHCVPLVTRDAEIRACGIETIW